MYSSNNPESARARRAQSSAPDVALPAPHYAPEGFAPAVLSPGGVQAMVGSVVEPTRPTTDPTMARVPHRDRGPARVVSQAPPGTKWFGENPASFAQ